MTTGTGSADLKGSEEFMRAPSCLSLIHQRVHVGFQLQKSITLLDLIHWVHQAGLPGNMHSTPAMSICMHATSSQ